MNKNSLKQQAYQIVKNKILNCEFSPGMLLTENMLCDMLSLGRTPVRDAISRLEQEHFVRIFPPKGIFVEDITLTDLNALFEARFIFEPYLINEYGKNVPKEELNAYDNHFNDSTVSNDPEEFCRLLSSFHSLFYEGSKNPYLSQFFEQYRYQEQRLLSLIRLSSGQLHTFLKFYREMAGFCLKGQWEHASGLLRTVLTLYRDTFFEPALSCLKPSRSPVKKNVHNYGKNNLKQQAYQIIRRKIINCEYLPGSLLNGNILLEAVPGSQTPIRDAVSRLEQEKLVTILPKKGILVAPLSVSDLKPVYETRLLLEPYVVLHYGNKLSEDFYMDMYKNFSTAESPQPDGSHYTIDDEFHLHLIAAADNPYISQVYEQIHAQTHRARVLCGNTSENRVRDSMKEHLDIIFPCLKKDWTTASGRMTDHLTRSRGSVLQNLSQRIFL
ncbi:GntR family transcriptional regulator [Clostridium sp. MCC353]|uniref:GntR family transcriptional regulator n=1 Tax=Clostridium sp. MCC353 TaxID=2592646 RepID=UPI001C02CF00|nr:GntR family transcriptional regulator [Clostridium sp. MCC353]MBT9778697.1 GntR family transcriptional regulator [Clostridium sp. MCC353]